MTDVVFQAASLLEQYDEVLQKLKYPELRLYGILNKLTVFNNHRYIVVSIFKQF
jgi:hypothetical protein